MNFLFLIFISLFSFIVGFFVGILCRTYQDSKKLQILLHGEKFKEEEK